MTLVEPGGARADFNRHLVLATPIPAYDKGGLGQLRGMLTGDVAREMPEVTVEQVGRRGADHGAEPFSKTPATATCSLPWPPTAHPNPGDPGRRGTPGGRRANTWIHRFDHESPTFSGRLGVAHAVEIPYMFDLLDEESGHALIGDQPPQAVADTAHGAWVRFVADGDPGWPRYDLADRSTALIDEGITVLDNPDAAERDVWASQG